MVKKEGLRKSIKAVVLLVLLALVFFAVFSFITIRTNINVVQTTVSSLRTLFTEPPSQAFGQIQNNLRQIYIVAILETSILAGAIITSLLAINYIVSLYFAARETSLLDELTRIYNRRGLFMILDTEISRARRFKHPLTLIMLDLDFFKMYNDRNGHVQGDSALRKVAGIITKKIRDVDTAARYGGEEFVIILPETSHDEAVRVAERIRKTVQEASFKGERKLPKGSLTVSLGLVTFHGEYSSKKRMIHSADEMLYKAKEEGRNQLIRAYYPELKAR
jgi:diguanylate cyclase (GGDEF)-like protein